MATQPSSNLPSPDEVDLFAPGFDANIDFAANLPNLKYSSFMTEETEGLCPTLMGYDGMCVKADCHLAHHPFTVLNRRGATNDHCWEKNIEFQIWAVRFSRDIVATFVGVDQNSICNLHNKLKLSSQLQANEFCALYFSLGRDNDDIHATFGSVEDGTYCQRLRSGTFCSGECGATLLYHHPRSLFRPSGVTKEQVWSTFLRLCGKSDLYLRWIVKYGNPDTLQRHKVYASEMAFVYREAVAHINQTVLQPLLVVFAKQVTQVRLLRERAKLTAQDAYKASQADRMQSSFAQFDTTAWPALLAAFTAATAACASAAAPTVAGKKRVTIEKLLQKKYYDSVKKAAPPVAGKKGAAQKGTPAAPMPTPADDIMAHKVVQAMHFLLFLQETPCVERLVLDVRGTSKRDDFAFIVKFFDSLLAVAADVHNIVSTLQKLIAYGGDFHKYPLEFTALETSFLAYQAKRNKLMDTVRSNSAKFPAFFATFGELFLLYFIVKFHFNHFAFSYRWF